MAPNMRVAVVTGASSGIGAATCRALRAEGWRVVGLSRSPAPDADEHEACDVSDRAMVDEVAARVLKRHPRIDLLVNNAGIPARGAFLDIDPERIDAVTRTNYLGSVWCLRAFLPGLEPGTHVVNLVSVSGQIALGPYSAAKHAQLAFSRSVAAELSGRGVAVHTINPGFVETPGFPQTGRFKFGLGRLVVTPDYVAKKIVGSLKRRRREMIIPFWYRPAGWVQAFFPATLSRIMGRLGIKDV